MFLPRLSYLFQFYMSICTRHIIVYTTEQSLYLLQQKWHIFHTISETVLSQYIVNLTIHHVSWALPSIRLSLWFLNDVFNIISLFLLQNVTSFSPPSLFLTHRIILYSHPYLQRQIFQSFTIMQSLFQLLSSLNIQGFLIIKKTNWSR